MKERSHDRIDRIKGTPRMLMTGAAVCALVCALMLVGCAQQPASDSSASDSSAASSSAAEQAAEMTVSVSMREDVTKATDVDSPLQFAEEQISVVAPTGATALEVLQATGREIQTSGEGDNTEVTAIGGLANGDAGDASHWMCEVNGETQTASPAVLTLSDGDAMAWIFVVA